MPEAHGPLKRYLRHLRRGEKLLVLKADGTLCEVIGLEVDRKHRRVNYEPGPEYRPTGKDEPNVDG